MVLVVVVARNAQNILEKCLAYPVTLLNSPPDEPRHALTIPFHGVLHVLNQLIKQLLTWYLTHDMQLRDVTALRA